MTYREKIIEGLEWILEGDRFGFGVNWDTDCEPKSEEEQAGINIQNAITLLKEQEAKPVILRILRKGTEVEMNNKSLEEQVKEAVECCKSRKCEGCPFNGVSACCVTVLLHIQHATATFEKDGHHLRCSNCGEYVCSKDCEGNMFPQKYCPNCGAKIELLKEQEAQRDYEASVEMTEYCERYEQTYNPEDGSL